MRMLPPSPPTDPDVQNYCIRFFAGELRGQTEDERAPNYRAPRHHAWPSLAESPVRLSIVVTWTRLWAQSPLACFPAMGLSHGASLPSFGSRRARFPALSGAMKALRLPIRVPAVTYLFRSRRPRNPSFVRVPPQRSWKIGGLFQAGAFYLPAALLRLSRVDASGISQVFRRSVPCLCCVPRPRSSQGVLASRGHLNAASATHTAKASAVP